MQEMNLGDRERVGPGDRFAFTVFLSVCVHVLIVFGIAFASPNEPRSERSLDVTIAVYRSEEAPDQADFRAQENQAGSGVLEVAAAPSTTYPSEFHAETIEQIAPLPETPGSDGDRDVAEVIATEGAQANEQQAGDGKAAVASDDISLMIASLQAQLDRRQQAYAKRPRIHTISSASTEKSRDALYLDNWRRRIESVGNRNYPEEAQRRRLHGSLRLLVAQLPDGKVHAVEVLASSGHELLDQAAVDIVHMAAPFEPFPAEMRAEVDILEIIRTWKFHEADGLISF